MILGGWDPYNHHNLRGRVKSSILSLPLAAKVLQVFLFHQHFNFMSEVNLNLNEKSGNLHKHVYTILNVPGTHLSLVLGVGPSKTGSFIIKTRVIWVPGIYIINVFTIH